MKEYIAKDEFSASTDSTLSVVYAADDNFAEILGISLMSLYDKCCSMQDIMVYIMDSGISAQNKDRICEVCAMYKREPPIWLPAKDISQELSMKVTIDRGSLSQYARLFVSSILPNDLERVLYLDCDTIIHKSLEELWNLDMKDKTVAVLMDAFSKHYRKNINLHDNDIMFNSGVMLINLKCWKAKKVEEKILDFIVSRSGKIQQGDQGALNAALSRDSYCFEPRFNSVTIFYDFNYKDMLVYRKPPLFYGEEQIKRAVEEPVIIHFTTSFLSHRPWVEGCRHRYVGEWLKYKKESPWRDMVLQRADKVWRKQLYIKVYKWFPSGISVRVAAILQVYVRPIKNGLMR